MSKISSQTGCLLDSPIPASSGGTLVHLYAYAIQHMSFCGQYAARCSEPGRITGQRALNTAFSSAPTSPDVLPFGILEFSLVHGTDLTDDTGIGRTLEGISTALMKWSLSPGMVD